MSEAHIIIVNYNAGDWLLRSVESALSFGCSSVTVVDNNSTDNSIGDAQAKLKKRSLEEKRQNIAVRDNTVSWMLNNTNLGFAAANNQVLRQLTDDTSGNSEVAYAVLMNPDCELSSGVIEALIDAFNANPKMGLVSCQILNEDGSPQSTSRRRFPTPWTALVRMLFLHRLFPNNPKFANFDYGAKPHLLSNDNGSKGDDSLVGGVGMSDVEWVDAVSGAFMAVRLSAIDDVGMLDEEYFMHCEDLDWCKRFANAGWQVGFVPSVSVIHAKGISTRSRPVGVLWTLHKGMNRFFDKFYSEAYSLPIRYAVKAGIVLSFLARAGLSLVRGR